MGSSTTSSQDSLEDSVDLDNPWTHYNLALEHWEHFEQSWEREELEKSIIHNRTALELCPKGHPDCSDFLYNLALCLYSRYEHWGQIEDLEESIELGRAALKLRPEGHPDGSSSLNNLASSLTIRYKQQGRTEDLEEAIELHRATLELRPEGHPRRSISLNNLANALITRYEQQGRVEDLEEAIELHRAALELLPEGHPDRFMSLNNLANSLTTRYEQQGRTEDLEEAIELHRATLELLPEGHPRRSSSLNNLASALTTRYYQQGSMEDLEEAIELHRAALELLPEGHPDRSMSLNNLANSLTTQYEQQGRKEDLEETIELNRAALELFPDGHPDSSSSLNNLANALTTRYGQQGRIEDLEKAIELHRAALDLRPEGHPDPFSGLLVRLPAAQRWVTLARLHNHISTFTAYEATTSILQYALTINPTLREQHDFLLRNGDYRMLALDAASYAIEKGQLEQAVEILEQGRGLLWSQLRGLRTPLDQLAEMNEGLADRFRDLLRLKKQLSHEQDEIINEIRRVPGFESFLAATPFKELQWAASEGPIIIVNHSKYRSDALIILPYDVSAVVCVQLDKEFYNDSIKLCNELVETRGRLKSDPVEYDKKLCEAMRMLWDRAVSKVVDKFSECGVEKGSRIWWCPTSVLSALPFHAAGPYKDADGTTKYLLDDYISSYTPTIGALISARSKVSMSEPKLLIVGDTATLRSTRQEIRDIRNCLGCDKSATTVLLDRRASHRTVLTMLQKVTWVHFACHGHLDPKPFDSSFKLSGRNLTLLDVIRANVPNAEFAFLSACHTAELSHSGAHDEALHLSAAMQFSGFRSVIGTMWELYDEDGPHFARVVYEYMNDCEDSEVKYKRAAAGLRKAALELRAREGIPTERWVNFVHIGA
ncbi:uncharacterized protein FOMMEDRAFT_85871 [Fomitiporia mediterranea MF3/22]|uniref:uncharacterized protein n=1 Tax=Fomitiporia mediterranea (strain MF3/22) TaxID=694068 RepID=UPI0004407858|nr:uncharacterized protein FOMMEDRAFT_85871 [Fomitiporia mediterranea MF3/22]EJD03364.1 hypothetical protein FOMMEDRAFT_85871 [Fomitiporia mediterranea MF3/22]